MLAYYLLTTPRNLVQSTRSISTSLILTLVRGTIDLFEKIMKLVFVTFKESLFTLNHVDNIRNTPCSGRQQRYQHRQKHFLVS